MRKFILSLAALASILGLAGAKANLGDSDAQLRERSTVEPAIDGHWRMWAGPGASISQWISPETGRVEFVFWVKRSGAYSTEFAA
jgi:hypothetical protein